MHKQRLFIIIAAGVALIALFLPWASTPSIQLFGMDIPSLKISGYQEWTAWGAFGLLAGAAGLAFSQGDKNLELDADNKKKIMGMTAGAVGLLLFGIFVRYGIGFASFGAWILLLAAIAGLAAPFVIKGDGGFEMPNKDTIKADLDEDTSNSPEEKTAE